MSCNVPGHLDALLRGLVLGKLGKAGHKATLEEARRRFKDHVEGKQILSADLRSPVRPAWLTTFRLFYTLPVKGRFITEWSFCMNTNSRVADAIPVPIPVAQISQRLFFVLLQVYLTVLKHGDSSTLETMLKVTGHCARHTVFLCCTVHRTEYYFLLWII